LKLGMAMEVVLERLNQRVHSKDLKLMSNTIIIQRRAGGNLSEALEQMAKTLEDREKVNQELKNTTAESRFVAIILAGMPFIFILMFNMVFKGFLMPIFTLPGLILMIVVFMIIGFGILLIRMVSNVKV